jgi:outer membrane lipoprotein-sorting protein
MRNLLSLVLLLLAFVPAYAAKITNGSELIAAMHKKYDGKWYKTLTFKQKNTQYKPDGTTENSYWYEALSAPGKLRIDFDPLDKGEGIMFADGMQHSFKDGKLARSTPFLHPLLVLGFDVYVQPVEKTVEQLGTLKIDMSVLHEDTWQGAPVYVVGAKQGDLTSAQFWVDKKNLYFVRMLQPVGKNKDHTQETLFNKYEKANSGGWISTEVVFSVDGKKNWMEEYSDTQTNVALDKDLFDTGKWMSVDRKYFVKK